MKTNLSRVIFWVAHGLFISVLATVLIGFPFLVDEDAVLNKWTIIATDRIFKDNGDSSLLSKFYFIDTDGDLALTKSVNSPYNPNALVAVANRKHLAKVFDIIKGMPYSQKVKGILCDIQFLDSTKDDSLLMSKVQPLGQLSFFPTAFDEDNKKQRQLAMPLPNTALIDYAASDDKFLKYDFIGDDRSKTLPLLMFEKIYRKKITVGKWFLWVDGQPFFKSFVPRLYIQNRFIKHQNNYDQLMADLADDSHPELKGTVFDLVENIYKKRSWDGKIIVIGNNNFEGENFKTALDAQAGPVILANSYLCLAEGDNRFHYSMVLLLAVLFAFPSSMLLRKKPLNENLAKKSLVTRLLYKNLVKYPVVFVIISIINFILYGTHISIALLSLYFAALDFVIHKLKGATPGEKFSFAMENLKKIIKIPIR